MWITRENSQGIFNIKIEGTSDACTSGVPGDTEWAYGTTANYNTLTYQTLGDLIGCNFSSIVDGRDMVVHLITDDIYIDIKFLSWTSNGAGGGTAGGFSYERSTDQTLSTNEIELENSIKLFPNPSSELIQISGLKENENYRIYNILGTEIKSGIISNNEQIDIRNFTIGFYLLKFENENTIKFIKE